MLGSRSEICKNAEVGQKLGHSCRKNVSSCHMYPTICCSMPPTDINGKALAKRLDFSLDFLLDKKSRKKSSRLATLLSESSGVE